MGMKKLENPDSDPRNQARLERLRDEHEKTGLTGKWLGQNIIAMAERLKTGDPEVTELDIKQQIARNLQFLQGAAGGSMEGYNEVVSFHESTVRHFIKSPERLDPETVRYLKDTGISDINIAELDDDDRDLISKHLGDVGQAPYQLYVDMMRLRLEDIEAHLEERQEQLDALKAEFLEELPTVINELNLPIDLDLARSRLEQLSVRVVDPLVMLPNVTYRKIHGYYEFSGNVVGVAYELFDLGRGQVKALLTHEFYHVLSGYTALIDQADEAGKTVKQQRLGVGFIGERKTDDGKKEWWERFRWLNEAITDTLAVGHLDIFGSEHLYDDVYVDDRALLQTIYNEVASYDEVDYEEKREAIRQKVLAAYFENFGSETGADSRIPAWKAMIAALREAYGPGVLLALDETVARRQYDRAEAYLKDPDRVDAKTYLKELNIEPYFGTHVETIMRFGGAAVAMLSGEQAPDANVISNCLEAIMSVQAIEALPQFLQHELEVPKRFRNIVDRLIAMSKDKKQPVLKKLVREQLQRSEELSIRRATLNDPPTARLRKMADLAILADGLAGDEHDDVADMLALNSIPDWIKSKHFAKDATIAGEGVADLWRLYDEMEQRFELMVGRHLVLDLLKEA